MANPLSTLGLPLFYSERIGDMPFKTNKKCSVVLPSICFLD